MSTPVEHGIMGLQLCGWYNLTQHCGGEYQRAARRILTIVALAAFLLPPTAATYAGSAPFVSTPTRVKLYNADLLFVERLAGIDVPHAEVTPDSGPNSWPSYTRYVIEGAALLVVATLLIMGLLWQRKRRRTVEDELALTYERLRLAVEAGRSAGWDWDLRSGSNRLFGDLQAVFGISSDYHSGHVEDFRSRIHPDDRESVWKAVDEARQSHRPFAREFRIVRPDGIVCWIAARGEFHYSANGDPVRMVGMAVDISERKHIEEALKKSEERFSKAFHESPLAITLTSAKDYRYLDVNETFEQITGWRRDEVVGKTPFDIDLWQDPSERLAITRRLLARGSIRNYEIRVRCRDGTTRTGLGSAELIDIDNEPCMLSVVADITDRKDIEERLHASEERLAGIVASAMDAIIAIDENQRIVLFNAAAEKMFGCDMADVTGTSIDRFIPARFRSQHPSYIRRFGDSGVTNRRMGALGALWAVRGNGEEFPIEASISHVETDGTKLFTVIIRDITERKSTEDALTSLSGRLIEAQEEERRRIAREIHDDYNQRLAVLAIDLEELAENTGHPGIDMRKRLHELWNSVSELGADLHALSHRLHSSTLDSLGLVAGVRAFCEEFTDQQEVTVNFVHINVPRYIPGDAALCLFRIVQESLRNIKRHSGANLADVLLEGIDDKLHLSITDHGRGFDPKKRSNKSGIGIRSMEDRLRLLGGQFQIHSRLGEGTKIEAWLPVAVTTPCLK